MDGVPRITSDRIAMMERYVGNGNDVVNFKLVRTAEDIRDPAGTFHPSMCHQIFNEQETIFGYENLQIDMYFMAGSLKPYVGINYKSKLSPKDCDGVEPDNIAEKLDDVIRDPYEKNSDKFEASVPNEVKDFRPLGDIVYSFTKQVRHEKQLAPPKPSDIPDGDELEIRGSSSKASKVQNGSNGKLNGHTEKQQEKTFVIYQCDATTAKFVKYLHRMEAFLLWFVDAASFIDPEDDKWKFFVMFEKYKTPEGNDAYAFVGYASVYEFYAYPANIRPRVGQMLILPPFQRQGLGVELLSTIYKHYRADKRVTEITVEDPSDDFEALRDFVDVRDCMKLASFAPEKLRKGYQKEMSEEASSVLKLTKRQARRMYELLLLRAINVNNDKELRTYRLEVKARLNIPFKKQENDMKRMISRTKGDTQQLQQKAQMDDATRKVELESNFQNAFQHYQAVLERLDKYA